MVQGTAKRGEKNKKTRLLFRIGPASPPERETLSGHETKKRGGYFLGSSQPLFFKKPELGNQ
jgi:hypothetical protein